MFLSPTDIYPTPKGWRVGVVQNWAHVDPDEGERLARIAARKDSNVMGIPFENVENFTKYKEGRFHFGAIVVFVRILSHNLED